MNATWNYQLFKKTVALAADSRNISKEQLFEELAEALNISARSVKDFQTPKGRPSSDRAKKLEEIFGINFVVRDDEAEQLVQHLSGAEKAPEQYSDFVKFHIMSSATAILRFIRNRDFTEDTYYSLRHSLEENALAIPDDIVDKIEKFVKQNIDPLVLDPDNAFAVCREGTGHEEAGIFVVDDETAFIAALCSILDDIEEKFKLLVQELSPILTR